MSVFPSFAFRSLKSSPNAAPRSSSAEDSPDACNSQHKQHAKCSELASVSGPQSHSGEGGTEDASQDFHARESCYGDQSENGKSLAIDETDKQGVAGCKEGIASDAGPEEVLEEVRHQVAEEYLPVMATIKKQLIEELKGINRSEVSIM